ncbi:MAG: alpha/beta hydrolase [Bacteroidetes bacterium]|nr:MAG: alpha/beta hydrolase [Bacteroidota bacterium]
MKRLVLILIFASLAICLNAQQQAPIKYGDNIEAGGYKKVNGIRMYYEIYGSGKPLVLLHGSGGSIRNARPKIDYFKQYFKVIAIDSRAHGKSIDSTTKDLTYVQMASDIKVLLDSLNIDSAYVFGQSDGGILGLLIAINYPNKISRLATYGANLFPGKEAIVDEIADLIADTVKVTKDFNTKRLYSLLAYQPNITDSDLKKIKCPVLVISGDRDAIRIEHSIRIFNGIENSNLFIMPGATHYGSVERIDLFNLALMDFYNHPFSKVSFVDLFTHKH